MWGYQCFECRYRRHYGHFVYLLEWLKYQLNTWDNVGYQCFESRGSRHYGHFIYLL